MLNKKGDGLDIPEWIIALVVLIIILSLIYAFWNYDSMKDIVARFSNLLR